MTANATPRSSTNLYLLHCCASLREAAERNLESASGAEAYEWLAQSLGLFELHALLVATNLPQGTAIQDAIALALKTAEQCRAEEEGGVRRRPSALRFDA